MRPTGWAQAPLSILITAMLGSLPQPLTAFDQHPLVAAPQATAAAGRQQTSPAPPEAKPASKAGAEKDKAKASASLQDVAKRISTVLAEHPGRPAPADAGVPAGGGSPHAARAAGSASPDPPRPRPRPLPPAAAAPPTSLVTIKWDPALTSGGVALAWDSQLDPRRARPGDLGIRLVWSAVRPEK
jgi:hypothetical protein